MIKIEKRTKTGGDYMPRKFRKLIVYMMIGVMFFGTVLAGVSMY